MQVYALVHDGTNVLIVKKAVTNDLWGGSRTGTPAVVNAAGQWALPGGRADRGESASRAATRELREETGVAFLDTWGVTINESYMVSGRSYTVVSIKLQPSALVEVARAVANINIRLGTVRDGELSEAAVVPLSQLTAYLGVRQPIYGSYQQSQAVYQASQSGYSQSIDWYGEIAQYAQHYGV